MLIDLSQNITDDMPVYPGDTETDLIQRNFIDIDKYNSFNLKINMHAGTHIDGPMHLTRCEEFISNSTLDSFIGNGCLLDVRNQPIISISPTYENLIKKDSIVLLYTGFDKHYGQSEYYNDHPIVDEDFCKFLISKSVKMLGMDMPSPDQSPFRAHKLLLNSHTYIIENLTNLDKLLGVGEFEVIAFPLKIKSDSSIVRAVARFY